MLKLSDADLIQLAVFLGAMVLTASFLAIFKSK